MSLNHRERRSTREELHANLTISGLTPTELATRLDLDPARVRAALNVDAARPEDVWLIRDALDQAIHTAGRTPGTYSVLTETARAAAQRWFPLVDVNDGMNRTDQ